MGTPVRTGISLPAIVRSGPRVGITLPGFVVTNPLPSVPAQPTLTQDSGAVTIAWTTTTGATAYNVWRSPPGTPVWTQVGPGTSALTATDAPGTGTWQYAISALNVNGESARSTSRSITVTDPPPPLPDVPGKPTLLLASGTVTIDWIDALGALSYAVWRRLQGDTTWTQIGFSLLQSTTTDSPGVGTWEYSVSAINTGGESDKSLPSDPVTITSIPPSVNLVGNVTEIDDTTVQVAWLPAVAVEVSIIEPGQTDFQVIYTGLGNTIVTGEQAIYVSELTPGGSYSFRLRDI